MEIPRIMISSILFSGFFNTSKPLQQSCFQGTYVSMERLEKARGCTDKKAVLPKKNRTSVWINEDGVSQIFT
jgi:hypothetical protein